MIIWVRTLLCTWSEGGLTGIVVSRQVLRPRLPRRTPSQRPKVTIFASPALAIPAGIQLMSYCIQPNELTVYSLQEISLYNFFLPSLFVIESQWLNTLMELRELRSSFLFNTEHSFVYKSVITKCLLSFCSISLSETISCVIVSFILS